jgi:NAD(P)-dependent dehydrogenase (short-subunit alcohol dehydrogenase family)
MELGAELREKGAPRVWLKPTDVRDCAGMGGWAMEGVDAVGVPGVSIHCGAVLGPRTPLIDTPLEDWNETFDVNVTGTLCFLQATARLCKPESKALWIWVTSSVAEHGRARWSAYAASKAAVNNINETWAAEIADRPWISVALNPGRTRTDMRHQAFPDEDPKTLPAPKIVAQAFVEVVESWEAQSLRSGTVIEARDLIPELRLSNADQEF